MQDKASFIADQVAPGFKLDPFNVEEPVEKVMGDAALLGGVATIDRDRRRRAVLRAAAVHGRLGKSAAANGWWCSARPRGSRPASMAASAGPEIERLISLLAKLPGLGPRSARRAALALLKRRDQLLRPAGRGPGRGGGAGEDLLGLRLAGHPGPLRDLRRPRAATAALICVVEEVGALWAMERASAFRGRYHVLGGLLSALDGVGPEALRVGELVDRAADGEVREVILALPATVDGQTTAHYLADRLAGADVVGDHAGPRRAGGRRARLAGRRHHRPGHAGAAAGLTERPAWRDWPNSPLRTQHERIMLVLAARPAPSSAWSRPSPGR